MGKFTVVTALAVLLLTTPVFAQMAGQSSEPGTITMSESGHHQNEMLAAGRITEIDLANGTVTLDTGNQFTLAPSLQYTSFPALGQEVAVTYSEQDGKKVARVIDVESSGSQE
ncbi:MAG: hypothetical protein H6Q05_5043 [Acidobacteria bacterium]|nr:hypothetical protein [Acidobacteriota bacterium]